MTEATPETQTTTPSAAEAAAAASAAKSKAARATKRAQKSAPRKSATKKVTVYMIGSSWGAEDGDRRVYDEATAEDLVARGLARRP